jgi:hypothetical protein
MVHSVAMRDVVRTVLSTTTARAVGLAGFVAWITLGCSALSDFEGLTGAHKPDASDDAGGTDAGHDADAADALDTDAGHDVIDDVDADDAAADADACAAPSGTPVLMARTAGSAWTMTVDETRVYWTVQDYPAADGGNLRSALLMADRACCGTSCGQILAVFDASALSDIAADDVWVYVGVLGGPDKGRVVRVEKSTGDVEVLAAGQSQPFGLVVDNTHVYWTDWKEGALRLALKTPSWQDGGPGTADTVAAGLTSPGFLRRDPNTKQLFWLSTTARTLSRCYPSFAGNDASCTPTVMSESPSTQGEAWGLAVDDAWVYWREGTDPAGTVRRVSKLVATPTPSTLLADGEIALGPRWIDVDDEYVYWTNKNLGQVARLSKSSDAGVPDVWASVAGAHTCVVADDAVFVASWANGEVYRIPK